jgi:hypothetical protein
MNSCIMKYDKQNDNKTSGEEFFRVYRNKEKIIIISSYLCLQEKLDITFVNKNCIEIFKKEVWTKVMKNIKSKAEYILKCNSLSSILNSQLLKNLIPTYARKSNKYFPKEEQGYITFISKMLNEKFLHHPYNNLYITSLHLKNTNITGDNSRFIISLLKINKSLKSVNMSKCITAKFGRIHFEGINKMGKQAQNWCQKL